MAFGPTIIMKQHRSKAVKERTKKYRANNKNGEGHSQPGESLGVI
jgi:hypothetical protein